MENVSIITATYDGINHMSGITKKIRDSRYLMDDFIVATSSKIYDGSPQNTLYQSGSIFTSDGEELFIMYQFIKRKIYLKNYSILTVSGTNTAPHHPMNWIIQGSNNNQTWFTIDIQHTGVLDSKGKSAIFQCKRPGSFSFIKMKQIGPTYTGQSTYFRFNQFEFFGTLFPDDYDFYPYHHYVTKCINQRRSPIAYSLIVMICSCN